MEIEVNDKKIPVIINKKIGTKNIYIRVHDDLKVYVTANICTSTKKIMEVVRKNAPFIQKQIARIIKRNLKKDDFYYLGKRYNVIYGDYDDLIINDDTIYLKKDYNLETWFRQRARIVFKIELDKIYAQFPYDIPYPKLFIRDMKTRYGVCNTKLKKITLNLELIKMDVVYLDYVIVHELSHLVEANHSKAFWQVVGSVMPNYKEIRKELKNNE